MRIAGDNSTADKDKGMTAIKAAIEAGYNHFDHALEHFRRYNKRSLKKIFSNYDLLKSYYFNFIGIFGWFIVGLNERRYDHLKLNT